MSTVIGTITQKIVGVVTDHVIEVGIVNSGITVNNYSGGGVSDGNKGDLTVTGTGTAWTINPDVVDFNKMQNISSGALLGRGTDGTGNIEQITLGANLSLTGTTLNASGGGVTDGDKGDVNVSAGGTVWTVDNGAITNAKQASAPAFTLKGNDTGVAGVVKDLTYLELEPVLTQIGIDVTGVANLGALGFLDAVDLVTGDGIAPSVPSGVLVGRFSAGDGITEAITLGAGLSMSVLGELSAINSVPDDSITNAKLAEMPANTIKLNNTGSAANPIDATVAQAKTLLSIAAGDVSGLSAIATSGAASDLSGTKTSAFISDFNTASDARIAAAVGVTVQAQDGDLSAIAALAGTSGLARKTAANTWSLDTAGYITGNQTITFTGDATGSGTTSVALTIPDDTITNAKLANMPANTIKINNTGLVGDPIDGTVTQVKTLLAYTPADVGAAATVHTHVLADVTNVTITAANLNSLDDGVNSTLHFHDSDRSRANHTGTQLASTISDFSAASDARIAAAVDVSVQAFDADLSALAALTGTNTIYYRSAINTWSPVTIGPNITFSGGTLDSVGGGSGITSAQAGAQIIAISLGAYM